PGAGGGARDPRPGVRAGWQEAGARLWKAGSDGFVEERRWSAPRHALSVALSPDGRTLAVGAQLCGGIFLYDFTSGERRCQLWEASNMISRMAFSSDGRLLATAGVDFKVWDVGPETLARPGMAPQGLSLDPLEALMKPAIRREGSSDPEVCYAAGVAF